MAEDTNKKNIIVAIKEKDFLSGINKQDIHDIIYKNIIYNIVFFFLLCPNNSIFPHYTRNKTA